MAVDSCDARGLLSVVATPIGNLDDITLRGLARLREADLVLAEDTRRTRKLLTHHGVTAKLKSLHAHSSDGVIERCLAELADGKRLALVSDAGTPLISDPGAVLVERAIAAGAAVETIPGPTAVAAALSVCGLPFDSFRFAGFAPRSGARRRRWLERIAGSEEASVFFESPNRLAATLRDLARLLPQAREVAVCRELTKLHEEVVRGTAQALSELYADGARGEITVVVGAGEAGGASTAAKPDLEALLRERLNAGMSARDAARTVAEATGTARRRVYALAQQLTRPPR
ncbi:MAG: 16S rRNA (cytidine(1402)-2'-O)-methyltransferase [Myxococcales bacterium]|nr:16S rRNA (cytidine(1402)-2'-O)-methyltransferase [Myxococcales bacterium]